MPDSLERLKAALAERYHIESEIGSGGMATVYLAQDLKHDRKVAVKVLKPELATVMGTERFLAEIRTTAYFSDPHLPPLHDSGSITLRITSQRVVSVYVPGVGHCPSAGSCVSPDHPGRPCRR